MLETAFLASDETRVRTLRATELPFRPPSLGLVLKFSLSAAEACRPHLIAIRPMTPDGRLLANEATIVVPQEDISRPSPGLVVRTTVVVGELADLTFDTPGLHALVVFFDGAAVASLPIEILAPAEELSSPP